jgi:hypothetical protein
MRGREGGGCRETKETKEAKETEEAECGELCQCLTKSYVARELGS